MRLLLLTVALLGTVSASAQGRPGYDVQLKRLRVGDQVVTSTGSIGTVAGIFSDRDVSVKIGYSNLTFNRKDVAGAGCSARACDGDSATTRTGSQGEILGVFPSGDVAIKVGYSALKFARANIAIEGCVGSICSGDQVTTRTGSSGTVNGIFENGDISVKIGYSNLTFKFKDVSSSYNPPYPNGNSINRLPSVGETVFTSTGSQGEVAGVFANGDISVKIGYSNLTFNRENIAVSGCHRRLCSNDSVVTRTGSSGTLNGFFVDGSVSVKIGYSNLKFPYDSVARSN